MLAARLSPLDTLQIDTINPATLLKKQGEFG